jgi:hypothetical protein
VGWYDSFGDVGFQLKLESNILCVIVGLDPTIQVISDTLSPFFQQSGWEE